MEHREGIVGVDRGSGAPCAGGCVARRRPQRVTRKLTHISIEEVRRGPPGADFRVIEDREQERGVRVDAFDAKLAQGPSRAFDRVGRIRGGGVTDDLGQQRVEAGVRLVAGRGERVSAQAGARRRFEDLHDASGRSHRAVGPDGLEVHTRLHREPSGQRRGVEAQVSQRLARGEAQLRLHQVDAHDLFGDGVLDLESCVRLDEPVSGAFAGLVAPHQELHRPRVLESHLTCDPQRVAGELVPGVGGEPRRGRHLDELLVAALDAAVPFAQVDHRARVVAEHLHLDVAHVLDQLLHVHASVAERRGRLGPTPLMGGFGLVARADHAHASASAAGDRLDHHRAAVTEAVEERERAVHVGRFGGSEDDRHAALLRERPSDALVSERSERAR